MLPRFANSFIILILFLTIIIFVKSTSVVDTYKYKNFCLINKTDSDNKPLGLNYTDAQSLCKEYGINVGTANNMHRWQLANFRSNGERFLVDDGFSYAHIPRLTAWVSGILNETNLTWSNTTSWFTQYDLNGEEGNPFGREAGGKHDERQNCASVSFGGQGSHVCVFVTSVQKRVFRRIHITKTKCNATQFGSRQLPNRHALCESFSDQNITIINSNMQCISILNLDLSVNEIFKDTAMLKTTRDTSK